MINIVFEGTTGAGKTTLLKKIKDYYCNRYKIGYINDIDKNSPLYNVIYDMFNKSPLLISDDNFNTIWYESLVHAADYMYLREMLYNQGNDINLFDRNYSSVFSYQSILMKKLIHDSDSFMNNLLECMKIGEKNIDLMVFFDVNVNKAIKRTEIRDNRKFSNKEVKVFKEFNVFLKNFIRYNNSDYKLLIIENDDTLEEAFNKIIKKIDDILLDKEKDNENKWCELYKIDVEEFEKPDDYFEYKLKYKKKFVKKILKYANNKKNVLEAGCGTGLMAGYLQKQGLEVTALDLSESVLNYAEKIASDSQIILPCSKYQQGDILNLKYNKNEFDVVYSNGVLEHFNDKDIIKILKQQLKISKYVIFGVPIMYFNMNEKMLGNERCLSIKEWKDLINKAGGDVVEQTSFHYYNFYRRIIEIKKWFKPKAFLLFIIKSK